MCELGQGKHQVGHTREPHLKLTDQKSGQLQDGQPSTVQHRHSSTTPAATQNTHAMQKEAEHKSKKMQTSPLQR